jgi:hypothetical protein
LLQHAESLNDAYRKLLNSDTSRLRIAVSVRTAGEDAVKARFEEIRKLIRDALEKT